MAVINIKSFVEKNMKYNFLKNKKKKKRKPSYRTIAKKQRKTIEWKRLEISTGKLEIPREYFMQRWAQ